MSRRPRPGQIVAGAVCVFLLATIAAWIVAAARNPRSEVSKLIIGANDEVYYFRPITASQAASVGQALQAAGFFAGKASAVQLLRWRGATTVSFALNNGGWDRPLTIAAFEEIGRRLAPLIGGYPMQINLSDYQWVAHRTLTIGKVSLAGDAVYYYGEITSVQATAVGLALQDAGYLKGLGVSVTVAKDLSRSIGFAVNDGVWEQADLVERFEQLTRRAAPALGGLPVELRLLSGDMDPKKTVTVQ
jgi:hypothetical protein